MNGDLIQALKQIERERNIPLSVLEEAVESALTSAYRKNFKGSSNVWVVIDWGTGGSIKVVADLLVVKKRKDPETEISLAQARKRFKKGEIWNVYPPVPEDEEKLNQPDEEPEEEDFGLDWGAHLEEKAEEQSEAEENAEDEEILEQRTVEPIEDPTADDIIVGCRVEAVQEENPKRFGRIAASTTRQVIIQKIREAERDIIFDEYARREGELISVNIHRFEHRNWICDLGKAEGVIPPQEQVHGEHFRRGERIKAYVLKVERTSRGPQVILSRSHPGLIRGLFEMEVPEIGQDLVRIQSVAREPGSRSKVAVYAMEQNVDPLGACVGPRGSRVQMVVDELRGEKIDIINYTDDPFTFVSNSLSPARVLTVTLNPDDRSALVIVPDNQFSLAIGKEGQNARLAAKLTNWKIDIKSESQAYEIEQQMQVEQEKREKEEVEQELKKREEEAKRREEEARRMAEEERIKREEEERRRQEEEELKRLEEEERHKEEEERRRQEQEELEKLRDYVPEYVDDEFADLEVLSAPVRDQKKQKEIESALKHIPKDVPVEQYVAMAFGDGDAYVDPYRGMDFERPKPKKKKKKKKRGRHGFGGYDFG